MACLRFLSGNRLGTRRTALWKVVDWLKRITRLLRKGPLTWLYFVIKSAEGIVMSGLTKVSEYQWLAINMQTFKMELFFHF